MNLRKSISMLLAMLLILSLVPASVFADDEWEMVPDAPEEELAAMAEEALPEEPLLAEEEDELQAQNSLSIEDDGLTYSCSDAVIMAYPGKYHGNDIVARISKNSGPVTLTISHEYAEVGLVKYDESKHYTASVGADPKQVNITFDPSILTDDNGCGVIEFNCRTSDDYPVDSHTLYVADADPGLRLVTADWRDLEIYPKYGLERNCYEMEIDSYVAAFFLSFFDGTNHTLLKPSDVTLSNNELKLEDRGDSEIAIELNTREVQDTGVINIEYNGYSLPVSIVLPPVGLYSAATPSADKMIHFDIDKFYPSAYLVARDSNFVIKTVFPDEDHEDYVKITPVKEGSSYKLDFVKPKEGMKFVDIYYTGTENGQEVRKYITIVLASDAPDQETEPEETISGIIASQRKPLRIYHTGEAFDPKDAEVLAYYNDNIKDHIDVTPSAEFDIPAFTKPGKYTIKAKYKGFSASFVVEVQGVQMDQVQGICASEVEYTGKAVVPSDLVLTCSGKTLVNKTDYTVKYKNNKAVGEATMVITLKGDYKYSGDNGGATITKTFNVVPADLSDAVMSNIKAQTYGGSELKPKATFKLGKTSLKAGKDYDIEYTDNVEIGEAVVTITGKGNYTGTAVGTFRINGAPISKAKVVLVPKTVMYTGEAQNPITLTYGKDKKVLTEGEDYAVHFVSDNAKVGKVLYWIEGLGNFEGTTMGTEAKPKNFKINAYDLKKGLAAGEVQICVATGVPVVTVNGKELQRDKDYTCKITEGKNDLFTFAIKGMGNYKGSVTIKETITGPVG